MEDNYSAALYEIEFQRAYKTQGRILHKIKVRTQQLKCYENKIQELEEAGKNLSKITSRINLTRSRLEKYTKTYQMLEDYKEEISVHKNPARQVENEIIIAAYEHAYAQNAR